MLKHRACLTLAALATFLVPSSAQEVKRGAENLVHRSPVQYPSEAFEKRG